jgi:RNA polymerase sigma-70 factor (ECF subfamily)
MVEQDFQHQIDSGIWRLIRIKSRQLAGKYGFATYDVEDIQQDLLLDYLKRSPSFNAHRCSRMGYARMIVRNRISTLVDERRAGCRDYRMCQVSLDQRLDSQSLNSVHSWLAEPNTGNIFEGILTLRLDVEGILVRLPGSLAGLCRLLMVCETSSEVASRAGISRATLYREIQKLRAVFAQAGMDSYRRKHERRVDATLRSRPRRERQAGR